MTTPYQVLPELSEEDYAALKADIASRGVLVPAEYDDEGNILDGRHRVHACLDHVTVGTRVTGCFPVLYVDPPWQYEHVKSESRAVENHYPTMALDELMALDIASICTDDCVLLMWATSPKLAEAMQLIEAWGFEYRTCAVWVKQSIGMGYYFRQQHELLLVSTRGSPPTPNPSDRPSSVLAFKANDHSSKPVEVYTAIERMYPNLPKLELFARARREGWAAWGNRAEPVV